MKLPSCGLIGFVADLLMDLVSYLRHWSHITVQPKLFRALEGAIKCHPSHDLRIREVLRFAANLPDALIRLIPDVGEVVGQRPLQSEGGRTGRYPAQVTMQQGIGYLAVDVKLELLGGRVADANRLGALVSTEPIGTSHSSSFRSPRMPYMICTWSGLPAAARSSQSRHALASSK